jgi:mono/diheme cytochrome c family protein
MSSSSDNPLVRFAAFWWALGVFALFGFSLLVVKLFTGSGEKPNALEEAAAAKRYEVRATVEAAQNAAFQYKEVEAGKVVQVPPHDVFGLIGQGLVSAKPVAVEKPEQIVPGSDRQLDLVNKPAEVDLAAVDALTPGPDVPVDPALIEAGKAAYMGAGTCFVCHGPTGEGGPIGPTLAGSEWVTGPVSNLIRIQLRGLEGPIMLKGAIYTPPAPMAALAHQDDNQIAAVLTYIRNSFGNKASAVLPEQVKMLRSEVGKPMLKEADLIKP